jgi:hypothetical protein
MTPIEAGSARGRDEHRDRLGSPGERSLVGDQTLAESAGRTLDRDSVRGEVRATASMTSVVARFVFGFASRRLTGFTAPWRPEKRGRYRPARRPDLLAAGGQEVEHAAKGGKARGAPDDAQVEADVQQARPAEPGLRQQGVEGVADIADHLAGAHKTVRMEELHVVGVEA